MISEIVGDIIARILAPSLAGSFVEGYEWYLKEDRKYEHLIRLGKVMRHHKDGLILLQSQKAACGGKYHVYKLE